MQNTGTWNSDLAIIFFACLLLPIVWYFFIAALEAQAAINAYKTLRPTKKPSKPSKPSKPMAINVSLSLPNFKEWTQTSKPIAVKKSPPPKKGVSQPKVQTPVTSNLFQNEAVSTLSVMGFKRQEASKIVKGLLSKKKYDSTESLIKDCLVCIS